MSHISEEKRNNIRALILEGLSLRAIAERCHVSRTTVSKIRKKYYPNLAHPRAGRPRVLSSQDRHQLVHMVTSEQLESSATAAKRLETSVNVHASESAVRNALHESGLVAVKKTTMPCLSEANIEKRRKFAELCQHWKDKKWENVIWSDETMVCRFGRSGKEMVWKRAGKKKNQCQYRKTMKHGGGAVRIWGRMTIHGVGSMVRIPKHVDQHLYKEILAKAFARDDGHIWNGGKKCHIPT
jgi:transposase